MEIEKIILIALGTTVSIIAFFLKKESLKIDRLSKRMQSLEIDLAKNDARDTERWSQIQNILEHRRVDIIKLFEKINK